MRQEQGGSLRPKWGRVRKESGMGLAPPALTHLLGHGVDQTHIEVLLRPKS